MRKRSQQIPLEHIDPDAIKVVRRLLRYGFEAYLVGGCVRDLLLDRTPKDFDVATSATPREIKRCFRNCRIIGRRFRLAHIFFGTKIIETSTFRAMPQQEDSDSNETAIIWRDNIFGSAEEDAKRRDFTINGLFYDLKHNRVIDHVGGLADLRAKRIKMIGDPRVRFPEDPVRILRAIKFATRLEFTIAQTTKRAMTEFREHIASCAIARVLEEIYRLLESGKASDSFRLMLQTGVLAVLFPEFQAYLDPPQNKLAGQPASSIAADVPNGEVIAMSANPFDLPLTGTHANKLDIDHLFWRHLAALDRAVAQSTETPTHALLLSAPIMGLLSNLFHEQRPFHEVIAKTEQIIKAIGLRLRVSKKDRERLKQILIAQRRLSRRGKRRNPARLAKRDCFADALKLFEMNCVVTSRNRDILQWWKEYLEGKFHPPQKRGRRRRRRDCPPRGAPKSSPGR